HKLGTNTGENGTVFAAIAFDCNSPSTLYASTDQSEVRRPSVRTRDVAETLHTLNQTNGSQSAVLMTFATPGLGEALGFFSGTTLFHRWGGLPGVYESINVSSFTATPIGFMNDDPNDALPTGAMTYQRSADEFLLARGSNFYRVSREGTLTFL